MTEDDKQSKMPVETPPTGRDAEPEPGVGSQGRAGSRTRNTILLVDDEVVVLKVARRILERLGYEVLSTPRALEALELARDAGGRLALAIIDLVMPGMGGRELLAELKKRYPETKVLVASGYVGGESCGDLDDLGCDGFIEKPFDLKGLETIVRNTIGPPAVG